MANFQKVANRKTTGTRKHLTEARKSGKGTPAQKAQRKAAASNGSLISDEPIPQ